MTLSQQKLISEWADLIWDTLETREEAAEFVDSLYYAGFYDLFIAYSGIFKEEFLVEKDNHHRELELQQINNLEQW